jgi:ribosomal protein L29
MATADDMIESLMRHYGDLRLAALPELRGEIEQLRREIARVLSRARAASSTSPRRPAPRCGHSSGG